MIRNRVLLKAVSVFLILEILVNTALPTISWALTAGPTAPEATSFEPVDTTTMVDLKTGDFVYNLPLLEVPGPAGSYPLSLSYHAGIQPDEDASWVGLGYTLNPGSIFRMVNGYPDDHNSVQNVDRSFWEGGDSETYTVGVSVGIANAATVSVDLAFANDTYKGSGVGVGFGIGVGLYSNNGISAGLSMSAGISPYGDTRSSMGLNVGVQHGLMSTSASVSMNDEGKVNAGVSQGISMGGMPLVEASISTASSGVSTSVGGVTVGINNPTSNRVSTNSDNFAIDIPIYYVNLRLGRSYVRYWIDEVETAQTFGALYMSTAAPSNSSAFDTYDLLDPNADIAIHSDPEKLLGGSFPDVDMYSVTAQGLSGNMQPYHFRQQLYRQDKENPDGGYLSKSYVLGPRPQDEVEFRFINDFSNRFEHTPADLQIYSNGMGYQFYDTETTGENGSEGYNHTTNHLAGSKHIEWYTNNDILSDGPAVNNATGGLVDCVAEGFSRESNDQIGGYAITNASGVTYHYALPVYSYAEFTKSMNSVESQAENGLRYNSLSKPERYAYAWYLTTVTGPDYVDRNANGIADHGDWGYWVNFEYKKWLGDYQWRNPGEGYHRDLDGEFINYSSGKKELYYLDRVVTESHVAVFEKSSRRDGREVVNQTLGGFATPVTTQTPQNAGCRDGCVTQHCPGGICDQTALLQCQTDCDETFPAATSYTGMGRSTARLNKIKLFNYDDFISQKTDDAHLLRQIDFTYDYSLVPGTPNSYDENGQRSGKLTLKQVDFLGKKGASVVPPVKFSYGDNFSYTKENYDTWGFFKSDFSTQFRDATNEAIGRQTTTASAANVDAWSLKKIVTPLGAAINVGYESDQYEVVALKNKQFLRTKSVTNLGSSQIKITFWEDVDLSTVFELNQIVEADLIGLYEKEEFSSIDCSCGSTSYESGGYFRKLFSGNATVQSIEINGPEKFIIVDGGDYYDALMASKSFTIRKTTATCGVTNRETCELTFAGTKAWPTLIPFGIISFPNKEKFGGGLRVNSILITDSEDNKVRETVYEYDEGTTSYERFEIEPPIVPEDYPEAESVRQQTITLYKRVLLKKFSPQIALSRNVPGPGVMYKYVTTREINYTNDGLAHELPHYSTYEFEVFNKGMVDITTGGVTKNNVSGNYEGASFDEIYHNKVTVKDYSARIGNLKNITLYDENDNIVSKTINHFLHDNTDGSLEQNISIFEPALQSGFSNQGVVEETYARARIMFFKEGKPVPYQYNVDPDDEDQNPFDHDVRFLMATIGKIERYPSVPTGQTNKNYKTGIESKTENLDFDFYSGEITKSLSFDSYGNRYMSVSAPAYKHYNGMGLKTDNKLNRHMLTQNAEQYSYVVGEDNNPIGLLSASIKTWTDKGKILNLDLPQTNIWRPQSMYAWNGTVPLNANGSYSMTDFNAHPFNWTLGTGDASWLKTASITLLDIYSHELESVDLNGNYGSARMNKYQNKVIASTSNSRYAEMGYSGSEYYVGNSDPEGGILRGEGNPSKGHKHTGEYSLLVGSGKKGFNFTVSNPSDLEKRYRASVWMYAPGEAETQEDLNKIQLYSIVDGQEVAVSFPQLQKSKSKSWYLITLDVNPAGADKIEFAVRNNSQRGVYFDDFRVHPLDASMTSYVYDPFSNELSYILDANNFYLHFEYDAAGRLVRTTKEVLNYDFGDGKESYKADLIVGESKYHYKRND